MLNILKQTAKTTMSLPWLNVLKLRNIVIAVVIGLILLLFFKGCGKSREQEARELLGQALVMETSGMREKAGVLYVRVIMDYPETEAAVEAKKRCDFRFEQRVENMDKLLQNY
jgi:plasmid stability protein